MELPLLWPLANAEAVGTGKFDSSSIAEGPLQQMSIPDRSRSQLAVKKPEGHDRIWTATMAKLKPN